MYVTIICVNAYLVGKVVNGVRSRGSGPGATRNTASLERRAGELPDESDRIVRDGYDVAIILVTSTHAHLLFMKLRNFFSVLLPLLDSGNHSKKFDVFDEKKDLFSFRRRVVTSYNLRILNYT